MEDCNRTDTNLLRIEEGLDKPSSHPPRDGPTRCAKSALLLAFELALVVFGSGGFEHMMHNKACGFAFRCGCTWDWAGGWKRCNVHVVGAPHCPWCEATGWRKVMVSHSFILTLMVVAWAVARGAAWTLQRRRRAAVTELYASPTPAGRCNVVRGATLGCIITLMMPLVAFAAHTVFVSAAFIAYSGYPYWFWFTFPNHQDASSPALPPFPPNGTASSA